MENSSRHTSRVSNDGPPRAAIAQKTHSAPTDERPVAGGALHVLGTPAGPELLEGHLP